MADGRITRSTLVPVGAVAGLVVLIAGLAAGAGSQLTTIANNTRANARQDAELAALRDMLGTMQAAIGRIEGAVVGTGPPACPAIQPEGFP